MKTLISGNYALSIAHPGHELRLHGFLETVKPFIFILADEEPSKMDRMAHYLGFIFKNTGILKKKRDAWYVIERIPDKDKKQNCYIQDIEIHNELSSGNTSFFEFYVKKMANTLIKDKINYIVVDAAEGKDPVHDINHVMTECAVELIRRKENKNIPIFEYNVLNQFNHNIPDDSIRIELNEKQGMDKFKHIMAYHPDVFIELHQNIPIDKKTINNFLEIPNGMEEIKNIIFSLNPDFFKYEYIYPVKEITHSEEYNKFILPVKEKLMKICQ